MICYRDMTFCAASRERCFNTECSRFFSDAEAGRARRWWGEDGAPVAFADFSTDCRKVVPSPDKKHGK